MRAVVFAYHDVGYACLDELFRAGADVAAVFTHDDDPGETVWFRSVRALADAHGVPVFAPERVNDSEWIDRVRALSPDFIFSFYYRKLLKPELLGLARRGALNLHGSLLPKYRGRAPVNWVLVHGERETGVTLHYMDARADHGDIVAQRAVPITDDDTALTLFRKLTAAAAALLREVYPGLCAGTAPRLPQDHAAATYFGGRTPADGRIDWNTSARQVYNLVRAVTHPYPGAFTSWNGRTLYIWAVRPRDGDGVGAVPGTVVQVTPELVVRTGDGAVTLERVQLDGDAEMSGSEWAALHAVREGVTLP